MTRVTKSKRIMAHREKMLDLIKDLYHCVGYNITLKQTSENINNVWFRVICLEETDTGLRNADGEIIYISHELMSVLSKYDAYAFVKMEDGRKYLKVYFH